MTTEFVEKNQYVPLMVEVASQIQANWEVQRGLGNYHLSAERASILTPKEILEHKEKNPMVMESILYTVLDEWLELYEAILHPEPVEAELLEQSDIGAYALRLYIAFKASHDEHGITYSEEESAKYNQLLGQAILGAKEQEFPREERTPVQKEEILQDLRHVGSKLITAYVNLVGAKLEEKEIAELVDNTHTLTEFMLGEGRTMTKEHRQSLLFLMMKPIIQATSKENITKVSDKADLSVILHAFDTLDKFALKHYGYGYFWTLVATLYTDKGKNGLNYPYPLPEGVETQSEFKERIRSFFPGRVIPADFDIHKDTPLAYLQRWHDEHPGEEYTVKAIVPDLSDIAEQLR